MSDGGKGDKRRPCKVSKEIVDLRWKLAFGNDQEKREAKKRLEEIQYETNT